MIKNKDELLEAEYKKVLNNMMKSDYKAAYIKNKKQDAELRSLYKAKALSKARLNIRKNELLKVKQTQREERAHAKAEAKAKEEQEKASEQPQPEKF